MAATVWNPDLRRMVDPVTGPLSREQFAELVAAPYGAAAKAIRKVDPMWGRAAGEEIKWRVSVSRDCREHGWVTVKAETPEAAEDKVSDMGDAEIDKKMVHDDVDITGFWEIDGNTEIAE